MINDALYYFQWEVRELFAEYITLKKRFLQQSLRHDDFLKFEEALMDANVNCKEGTCCSFDVAQSKLEFLLRIDKGWFCMACQSKHCNWYITYKASASWIALCNNRKSGDPCTRCRSNPPPGVVKIFRRDRLGEKERRLNKKEILDLARKNRLKELETIHEDTSESEEGIYVSY